MIVRTRAALVVVTGALSAGTLVGCAGHTTPGPTTYVTVRASPSSSASASASADAAAASSASASASASPTHSVATMTQLPGRCESLLPLASVVDALGRKVGGATAFVVGPADATIARVSYLNCRYGVTGAAQTPTIEIGVSLYRTPAAATARVQPTTADYTQHGATPATTTVAGHPATVLEGGSGAGYGPTIVVATGQRTVAVSLRAGAFAAGQVSHTLLTLAALALNRTAGD